MDAETLDAEGWATLDTRGFTGLVGGFRTRRIADRREVGFVVAAQHANHIGTCHGGMLMTLADNALGFAVMEAIGGLGCATAQLQIQFVAAARLGDFVVCRPELIRRSNALVFLRALISVGDRTIASADGIWKILDTKPAA